MQNYIYVKQHQLYSILYSTLLWYIVILGQAELKMSYHRRFS